MTGGASPGVRPDLPGGPYLVCGLARSGQAAARALARMGEQVIAVDSASPAGAAGLAGEGVEVHLDASGSDLVERAHTIVKSPGVPQDAPAIAAARRAGKLVIGELELGWRLAPGRVVAVTGTNGKTTVTEMVGHVLRECGGEPSVVGNVGNPISGIAGTWASAGMMVVEASSFQLEDAVEFAPDVAVLLNITPDHLDRHGTMEAYRSAKMRIFARQRKGSVAVLPQGQEFPDRGGEADVLTFGARGADAEAVDGALTWRGERLVGAGEMALPGAHNLLNAAAALAASVACGCEPRAAANAIAAFPGVPHRLELVLDRRGIRWFNDSKATNVASTLTALEAVERPVRLILGGQGKGQDFSELAGPVGERCVSVHLIGDDAPVIREALAASGVEIHSDANLTRAVHAIAHFAREGDSVLLSPGCASFDQFSDFEERGSAFRKVVREVAP